MLWTWSKPHFPLYHAVSSSSSFKFRNVRFRLNADLLLVPPDALDTAQPAKPPGPAQSGNRWSARNDVVPVENTFGSSTNRHLLYQYIRLYKYIWHILYTHDWWYNHNWCSMITTTSSYKSIVIWLLSQYIQWFVNNHNSSYITTICHGILVELEVYPQLPSSYGHGMNQIS